MMTLSNEDADQPLSKSITVCDWVIMYQTSMHEIHSHSHGT